MRYLTLLCIATLLMAKVHTVRLEPVELYHIKAAVAASVVEANERLEGKNVQKRLVVRLDDTIDRANLQTLQTKLALLRDIIQITRQSVANLQETMKLRQRDYERIKDLSTKSRYEKDQRKAAYLLAKNSYLGAKEKLKNLLMSQSDIELSIARTKDLIAKKNIKVSGYVYKVHPRRGDMAALGAPLVDVADISKARAVLYLTPQEIRDLDHKAIYINGKRTDLKFAKLLKITDQNYITQYRAELILPAPKLFDQFITVEIR